MECSIVKDALAAMLPQQVVILDAEMVAYFEQREAIDGLLPLSVLCHSKDIYHAQSFGEYVGSYLARQKTLEQA